MALAPWVNPPNYLAAMQSGAELGLGVRRQNAAESDAAERLRMAEQELLIRGAIEQRRAAEARTLTPYQQASLMLSEQRLNKVPTLTPFQQISVRNQDRNFALREQAANKPKITTESAGMKILNEIANEEGLAQLWEETEYFDDADKAAERAALLKATLPNREKPAPRPSAPLSLSGVNTLIDDLEEKEKDAKGQELENIKKDISLANKYRDGIVSKDILGFSEPAPAVEKKPSGIAAFLQGLGIGANPLGSPTAQVSTNAPISRPITREDFDKLKPGTKFINPKDGAILIKK